MRQIGEIVTRYNRYSLQRSIQRPIVTRYSLQSNKRRERVQGIAERMCKELESPKDFKFFLKCAWHLPENQIQSIVQTANDGSKRSPLKYATASLKNALQEQGL